MLPLLYATVTVTIQRQKQNAQGLLFQQTEGENVIVDKSRTNTKFIKESSDWIHIIRKAELGVFKRN